jgi:predicted SAM-dependent methyltransferase/cephalosporin hydroxylase
MGLFSRRSDSITVPIPSRTRITEGEAIAAATAAKQQNDWASALTAIEQVDRTKDSSAAFIELRDWALGRAGRRLKKSLWSKIKMGGPAFDLLPEDAMALTHLLGELRPQSILEIGSCGGAVAQWLATQVRGLGLKPDIHSADWGLDAKDDAGTIQFWSGDLRKPSAIWPGALLKRLPSPTLLLVRSMGGHEVTWSALRSMHKWLRKGAVICVENEPGADPAESPEVKRTSAHALLRFVARHPVEYGVVPGFEKAFGPLGLATSLIAFQHTGLDPLAPETSPSLDTARTAMAAGQWQAALDDLNPRKAERKSTRGVDYLRALCFVELGAPLGACEAAKEELRYFPDHPHAQALLASLMRQLFPGRPKQGEKEFHELYRQVRPYTMLSDERLYSLYLRTRLVCQMDIPGDMVECGVAAGGGSALIAATMARHSKRPRKLYSCDTFEGMPVPTEKDVAYSVGAEASGWGTGTCAAPAGSLLEICAKLGVSESVVPLKGFFKDTLPGLKDKLPDGIAFLHMDGDWYESTMDILVSLYTKVQMKGFIQVDDYGHWEGCRQAMWDYAKTMGFEFSVHEIDNTGVWLQRPDRAASDLMLLNLGCGGHFHRDWINLDIAPSAPQVIKHDLAAETLPFEDRSCMAVYHSHVLEHIPKAQAPGFIAECYRVLDQHGVIRIAVPDLEGITREYLHQLDTGNVAGHEWMLHEMVDQLARHESGGEMLRYWQQNPMPAEDLVFRRMGREAKDYIESRRSTTIPQSSEIAQLNASAVGAFRLSGEVHQWMYDRLSLSKLLSEAGFTHIRVVSATESSIPGYASYGLDADLAAVVRKPDSLFIEAQRPIA